MQLFKWMKCTSVGVLATKGVELSGSIENPEDPPTTVFSIMVSSLAKKYSTIVRLIPLGSSSAGDLLDLFKQVLASV